MGDVASGHRLFAWPNVWYDADVSPATQNMTGAYGPCDGGPVTEGRFQYDRPPAGARYAYFDYFKPEFDVVVHVDRDWQPDAEYLANRVSRLTVDLHTGHAELSR